MLDLKAILKDPSSIKECLKNRGYDINIVDTLIKAAKKRLDIIFKLEGLQNQKNDFSKKIGILKRENKDVSNILTQLDTIKKDVHKLNEEKIEIQKEVDEYLLEIPNIPLSNVPIGMSEADNKTIKENISRLGKPKNKIPHYEIAKKLGLLDIERAVKISGSRFVSYIGNGAKLVRALQTFMLDEHIKRGYKEFIPPLLVNAHTMKGTGQLPKFVDDLFLIKNQDLILIPTSEVPLVGSYSNEILDLTKPIALTAYTQCFRAEAGSGGRDNKGLIRLHQFNKVELVKITTKEQKMEEFRKTIDDAKNILDKLEISYIEVELCTADLGFSSEYTLDLELWIPSENRYRETSSISIFGDFQSRRSLIRYRDSKTKKTHYASTINGSGLAIDRVVAAILENYQNDDGTITVPNVLKKYMEMDLIK